MGKGRYPRVDFIDAFWLDHLQPAKLKLFQNISPETKSGKGKQQRLKIGKERYPKVDFIDALELDHLQPA